jgi:uncharacterized membrane protein YqaE (UPF0057 family)
MSDKTTITILKVISAIVIPPLAVWMCVKFRYQFWISVFLMLLFHIPSVIYALFIISDPSVDYQKLGEPQDTSNDVKK